MQFAGRMARVPSVYAVEQYEQVANFTKGVE